MAAIKGPALFLAQFVQDMPPYNTLENITQWAKNLGFQELAKRWLPLLNQADKYGIDL